jgi:hypothetical protein
MPNGQLFAQSGHPVQKRENFLLGFLFKFKKLLRRKVIVNLLRLFNYEPSHYLLHFLRHIHMKYAETLISFVSHDAELKMWDQVFSFGRTTFGNLPKGTVSIFS